jgi:hypothetical protein
MTTHAPEFRRKARILRRLLEKDRRDQVTLVLKTGALAVIGAASVSFLLFALLEIATRSAPAALRYALSALEGGFLLFVLIRYLAVPLLRLPGIERLAHEIERERSLSDLLVAAVDLGSRSDPPRGASPALMEEVVDRAYEKARDLRVHDLFFPERKSRAFALLGAVGLSVLLLWAGVSPGSVSGSLRALLEPASGLPRPGVSNLHAGPGDRTVMAGEDVTVYAVDFGRGAEAVDLRYDPTGTLWKRIPLSPSSREGGAPRYDYTFHEVDHSFSYRFEREGRATPPHRITVVHPPVVNELRVTVAHPEYTGVPEHTQEPNQGNVAALEGSRVTLRGIGSSPLARARVLFDPADTLDLEVEGDRFRGGFDLTKSGTYQLALGDSLGYTNPGRVRYSLECLPDNPPQAAIELPGRDATLPRSLQIPLFLSASDDYGLAELRIVHALEGETETWSRRSVEMPPPPEGEARRREFEAEVVWDLNDMELFPGDVVLYYLEAVDNNAVTGPGVGKSEVYRLRVPTLSEVYAEIEHQDAERRGDLSEVLEEGKQLAERYEKISRELKKNPQADWTRKKEMEKALENQEELREKVERIQHSLEETLEELSQNQATSREIGEKLEKIQELLSEVNSPELQEYLEKMRESLESLTPEELRDAMSEAQVSLERMLESLDRTINLLERLRQEQKMEELVRRTEQALQDQEEINRKTEEMGEGSQESERESLAREQGEMSKAMEELQRELKKLAERLQEQMPEVARQLREAAENLDQDKVSDLLDKASRDIERGDSQRAGEKQEQATKKMFALFFSLQQCQGGMQMAMQNQVVEGLEESARDLLDISFRQEKLAEGLDTQHRARSLPEAAREQQALFRAARHVVEHLNELSRETFFITQEMAVQMGRTLRNMQLAAEGLAQGRTRDAVSGSRAATAALNRTVIELLRQRMAVSSSGSGLGFSEMMSRMGKISEEQMQLNQLTREMMQREGDRPGGLTQEERAGMARMAGRQRALQEMLEKLQKEAQGTDRLLGDLDRVAQDMEEVIRDLVEENADQGTLERQNRILSRLLDAQRSIHRRDYEKQRVSRTAEDLYSGDAGPGTLTEERLNKLRQDIDRALQSRLPAEYERLIREYFRALSQEAQDAIRRGDEAQDEPSPAPSGR